MCPSMFLAVYSKYITTLCVIPYKCLMVTFADCVQLQQKNRGQLTHYFQINSFPTQTSSKDVSIYFLFFKFFNFGSIILLSCMKIQFFFLSVLRYCWTILYYLHDASAGFWNPARHCSVFVSFISCVASLLHHYIYKKKYYVNNYQEMRKNLPNVTFRTAVHSENTGW